MPFSIVRLRGSTKACEGPYSVSRSRRPRRQDLSSPFWRRPSNSVGASCRRRHVCRRARSRRRGTGSFSMSRSITQCSPYPACGRAIGGRQRSGSRRPGNASIYDDAAERRYTRPPFSRCNTRVIYLGGVVARCQYDRPLAYNPAGFIATRHSLSTAVNNGARAPKYSSTARLAPCHEP